MREQFELFQAGAGCGHRTSRGVSHRWDAQQFVEDLLLLVIQGVAELCIDLPEGGFLRGTHQLAQCRLAGAHDPLLQQPAAGLRVQGLTARHRRRLGAQMREQALALRFVTFAETEMTANPFQVFPSRLLILGIFRDGHRQHTELGSERLQHRLRQVGGVRQKVPTPSQGAELDGEAETVHAAATLLDLAQVGVHQQEEFSQDVFRNLGWQPILRFRC